MHHPLGWWPPNLVTYIHKATTLLIQKGGILVICFRLDSYESLYEISHLPAIKKETTSNTRLDVLSASWSLAFLGNIHLCIIGHLKMTKQMRRSSPALPQPPVDWLSCVRETLRSQGIIGEALNIINDSQRESTQKQYKTSVLAWLEYLRSRG